MQDIDSIFKAILLFSLSISILGISWQLTRFIGKMTETLDEFKVTNTKINGILDQFTGDYKIISSTLKELSTSLNKINESLLKPIGKIGDILNGFVQFFQGFGSHFLPRENEK